MRPCRNGHLDPRRRAILRWQCGSLKTNTRACCKFVARSVVQIYCTGVSYWPVGVSPLSHTIREKSKLLNRVSRLRGQIEAIERALEREVECAEVLQLIAPRAEPC